MSPPDDSQFEDLKYAVTSDTRNRVVADPARIQGYNILDSEWKDFAELVCNYLHKKTQWTGFYFLKAYQFCGRIKAVSRSYDNL